ncbi:4-hydroxythreonine-4-phosphate dehydrogenase PdxA [Aristophania vespae]|uniref:4-hydroxythreonine-4-phosphate dehydrogenase PdxA n=1 Tax=Aristophania vespae TaxID=2697033 RepID=UPI002351AABF|nr:4-hydroxythreonine-4-phosphate dehydrogenase PdxA [Aristophania vespae]UMM63176.1 D-threonate 4-phosphate dehydrogenase [Aristophania vespae]
MGANFGKIGTELNSLAQKAPLALTMGDPSGIGPCLTIKAWKHFRKKGPVFFWVGDVELIEGEIPVKIINSPYEALEIFPHALPIINIPCAVQVKPGHPCFRNAGAVIKSIDYAVEAVKKGEAQAIVTNPIAKYILSEAGFKYPGHTEYLAHLCDLSEREVMMLACPSLKVVLTTIHVSLRQAMDDLNTQHIIDVTLTANESLKRDFGIKNPRIAMAGLNPHAGEKGLMGVEEGFIISPAIKFLQEKGVNVFGPLPPDTMFSSIVRPQYDVAICHYHDQGLIPIKTLDQAHGVNVTLGLPIIRTSPDHGTAFDLVRGKGDCMADPSSLFSAIEMAAEMSAKKQAFEGALK